MCEVQQGPNLGPLLFLVHINDLGIVCTSTEPMLFADDTNLCLSGSTAFSFQDGVNDDLAPIAEWLKINNLSSNINNTYVCGAFFLAKSKTSQCIYLQIDF